MVSETSQSPASQPDDAALGGNADGNLLILLTAGFYSLFSLVSSNQTIVWPWVALWQAALILPIVWLLWQLWHKPLSRFRLGNGFDWLAAIALVTLMASTGTTAFRQPAVWYGIGTLSGLATLYGLVGWLTRPRIGWLLRAQAALAGVFILTSLGQWIGRVYWPESQRLKALQAYGLEPKLDINALGIQNWFPLGHQNYVAGYVVLLLPLLAGLTLTEKAWRRGIWGSGLGLGLVTLYTTGSRGGTLGLLALLLSLVVGAVLLGQIARRIWVPLLVSGAVVTGLFLLTNERLSRTLAALAQGNVQGGGIAYRAITNVIGWRMGQQPPWVGAGVGSATNLFQRYRPLWAGREAELHYQLHSTPAQLWGELGLAGGLLPVVTAGLLAIALWRQRNSFWAPERSPAIWRWSLLSGLWGYGVLSLTDYQLDVIPITGSLIVYTAVLLFELRQPTTPEAATDSSLRRQRSLVLGGIGLLLALIIWLMPLHRAWAGSARGFVALSKGNPEQFVADLQRAHELSPGEPYYPFMLGWVLGNVSYQVEGADVVAALRADARSWFQIANNISPFQEFGHSNLGWLNLPEMPAAAIAEFVQSARLVPAKQGVFFGLGYSLFLDDQRALATEAIALEILRNPSLITNLPLNGGDLSGLQPGVFARVEELIQDLLASATTVELTTHLHQVRGMLRYWHGDLDGATQDWSQTANPLDLALLAMTQAQNPELEMLPTSPGKFALMAWQDSENRRQWLETAWLAKEASLPQLAEQQPPAEQIEAIALTMDEAETFEQWLKNVVPYVRLRSERLGYGVLMRHDDGPSPTDFYARWENLAISRFFETLVLSPQFSFELDQKLQPYREALLQKI
ncbi:MAG: O-antigen ligase family protein [Cyanobacteria bacterium P01_D01_bin.71]